MRPPAERREHAALVAYLVTGALLGQLAAVTRRRAEQSEVEVRVLADEQAALRRVATLVAVESSPERVFGSVTEEVGTLLDVDHTVLLRYETDGTATVAAAWSRDDRHLPVGSRWPVAGATVASSVQQTGRPQRQETYGGAGVLAASLREMGVRSSVGSPVVVEGRLWGVMVGASYSADPLPKDLELRLGEFTHLAGTAVANAESRGELTASRARVVDRATGRGSTSNATSTMVSSSTWSRWPSTCDGPSPSPSRAGHAPGRARGSP